jgi:hypothetical protein
MYTGSVLAGAGCRTGAGGVVGVNAGAGVAATIPFFRVTVTLAVPV